MSQRMLGVLLALVWFALPAAAQSGAGKDTTITGQVVDLNCYAQGHSGATHKMCAESCAKAGVQLGILGTDGTLYVPISGKPADPTNPRLLRFAEETVRATGVHRVVNGLHLLELRSVAAAS